MRRPITLAAFVAALIFGGASAACIQPFDAAQDADPQGDSAMPPITRPTEFPRWATDETNNTPPSAGQKDTGWEPGQDGVSDYENWKAKSVYQWIKYLETRERELWIPAHVMSADEGEPGSPIDPSDFWAPGYWQSHTTEETAIRAWIPLAVGDRLRSVTVYGAAGGSAGEELHAAILFDGTTTSGPGAGGQISTTKSSALAAGDTSVEWDLTDTDLTPDGYELQTGQAVYVDVSLPTTSSAGEVKVYSIKVVWDRAVPATD